MRKNVWILLIVGVLACGLLAAGCGGNDDTSSTTEVTVEGTDASTTTSGDETTVDRRRHVDRERRHRRRRLQRVHRRDRGHGRRVGRSDRLRAGRDAFEQCAKQAEAAGGDAADTALGICQQAADQAVKSLQAARLSRAQTPSPRIGRRRLHDEAGAALFRAEMFSRT